MSKNNTEDSYHSFEEYAEKEWKMKPIKKVTRDKQKLESQREKFLGTCPFCKQQLRYVEGTNVLVCQNENCKGKKISSNGGEDGENSEYRPYFRILSEKGSMIAENIF